MYNKSYIYIYIKQYLHIFVNDVAIYSSCFVVQYVVYLKSVLSLYEMNDTETKWR